MSAAAFFDRFTDLFDRNRSLLTCLYTALSVFSLTIHERQVCFLDFCVRRLIFWGMLQHAPGADAVAKFHEASRNMVHVSDLCPSCYCNSLFMHALASTGTIFRQLCECNGFSKGAISPPSCLHFLPHRL